MNLKLPRIGVFIAGIALAVPAFAATNSSLPPEHKTGSVSYMSGGIGSKEAKAMQAAEKRYNLSLEFAKRAKAKNEFLADVSVLVKNKSGKMVLDTNSEGPFLLADMPAGKYTIIARYEGHKLTRTAYVRTKQHKRLFFLWPEKTAKM